MVGHCSQTRLTLRAVTADRSSALLVVTKGCSMDCIFLILHSSLKFLLFPSNYESLLEQAVHAETLLKPSPETSA